MIILELSDIQLTKQANSAGLLRWQACRKIEVTQGPSRTGSFSHSTQLVNSGTTFCSATYSTKRKLLLIDSRNLALHFNFIIYLMIFEYQIKLKLFLHFLVFKYYRRIIKLSKF